MNSRRLGSWLWALAPAYTLGFATPVIMVHAAVRTRDRRQAATVPVYVLACIFTFVFADGNGHDNDALFGTGMVIDLVVGLVHAVAIRGWVFGDRSAASRQARKVSAEKRQAQALARAREEHEVRDHARELVRTNPAMARELGIGRPDKPHRDYPDGGLVDVNHVAADVLTGRLGMPPELAQRIVSVRDQVRAFDSYDDLLLLLDSDGHELAEYADRMVFVPDA